MRCRACAAVDACCGSGRLSDSRVTQRMRSVPDRRHTDEHWVLLEAGLHLAVSGRSETSHFLRATLDQSCDAAQTIMTWIALDTAGAHKLWRPMPPADRGCSEVGFEESRSNASLFQRKHTTLIRARVNAKGVDQGPTPRIALISHERSMLDIATGLVLLAVISLAISLALSLFKNHRDYPDSQKHPPTEAKAASRSAPRLLHTARVPIFCDSSRNCRRKILPILVFGSSVLNSTSRGTL